MLGCIDILDVVKYVLESQFVSTCLALAVGSVIIEKINFRRNSDREMIKTVHNEVDRYDDIACAYWGTYDRNNTQTDLQKCRDVLAAKLKVEYPFLVLSIEEIDSIKNKDAIKESLEALYDAATDGDFEVSKEFGRDEVRRVLVRIVKASSKVKHELYREMM